MTKKENLYLFIYMGGTVCSGWSVRFESHRTAVGRQLDVEAIPAHFSLITSFRSRILIVGVVVVVVFTAPYRYT